MIGIYKITNPFNQVYIGQTTDILRRFRSHKNGHNSNYHLMMSIKKHGFNNHKCEVIEECNRDELITKERHYLSVYKKDYLLFNYSIYLFNHENRNMLIENCDYGINKIKEIRTEKLKEQQLILESEIKYKESAKEIKTLYSRLKYKKKIYIELSKELQISPLSIYNHWFGSFWAIPEKYQNLVLNKLKEKN